MTHWILIQTSLVSILTSSYLGRVWKKQYKGDNPADVKAAEKMAKLFDFDYKADNFNEENKNDTAALHGLNVFLTRLLFCFFAEDTGIFTDNQFSSELESHTKWMALM